MLKNRLRELREARGMSQESLGNAVGYPKTLVSKVELGRIALNHDKMVRFAEALRCAPWELIARKEDIYPPEHQRIIDAYFALDDATQALVANVLFGEKKAEDHPLIQRRSTHAEKPA